MSAPLGLCTTLPEACPLAAAHTPQPLDTGRCSTCGASLMAPAQALTPAPSRPWLNPRWWLGLAVLTVLVVSGWWAWQRHTASPVGAATTPVTTPPAAAATLPPPALRLHGSNTVGAVLAPALVKAFLQREGYTEIETVPQGPEESVIVGRRPADGHSTGINTGISAGSHANTQDNTLAVALQAHGTATGFTALAQGKADIGMASRAIKPDEIAATQTHGDLSAEGSEYVIALDGIAVIVHPSNPLQHLTVAQLRDLLSGTASDWSAVGGPAGPVHLHTRDDRSGTWDTVKALVLDKQTLASTAVRHEDSKALADAVATDPQAIGFVGLPYARQAKTLAISDGDANPLRPSRFTVATEDYALARRLYFYVPRNAAPIARRLADFAVSNEAQKLAQEEGYIGQIPDADDAVSPPPAQTLPPAYVQLTRGARRLAINLRFRSGSDQLDNKALRDVARIAQLLESRLGQSQHLMLLGFSDPQGDACANQAISLQRAKAVAHNLSTYGIQPAVVQGYGPAAMVATNNTAAGRERNRRVEVWLTPQAVKQPAQDGRCAVASH